MASKASSRIIFYDTSRIDSPEQTASPWTVVTQWSLRIKGLSFERQLCGLADTKATSTEAGFKPTTGPLGSMHTFPAIHDLETGAKVSDSFAIAEYLDNTYSNDGQPRLIPQGTKALQKAFLIAMMATEMPVYQFILPKVGEKMKGRDQEYFIRTIEGAFGKSVEEFKPKSETVATEWAKVKGAFDVFNSWFEEGETYLTGCSPVLADLYLAGRVFWMRLAFGTNSKEWKDLLTWNGGRWGRLWEAMQEKYPLSLT